MPTKMKLNRLERVRDLRACWDREDTDFTPWLAQEDNIQILGDTIGIELEVQQQEASVGPFRADILCRDTSNNQLVLIENQLERTDHGHLGQLFTYAAGLDTVTVIWIAARFTEEHRAAMDWLNKISHDDFNFFGLEIELWRIGNSAPAAKFNVVAKPNDWSRTVAEARMGGGTLTPGQEKQVEFWTEFGAVIEETGSGWKVPKPQPSSWIGYGIGRSAFNLNPTVAVNAGWVALRLTMWEGDASAHFHLLQADREAIEADLGFSVDWNEKPGKKECSIECRTTGDLSKPKVRARLIRWMLDKMDTFDRVFRPRVKVLDAADWESDDGDEEGA